MFYHNISKNFSEMLSCTYVGRNAPVLRLLNFLINSTGYKNANILDNEYFAEIIFHIVLRTPKNSGLKKELS
jgi:hypothetical protein